MHRSHFKLSKYKSMYFHCLNSGLKLKTKHFQINAFLSQRIIVFSWFHFCRIPNTIINIDHMLYIFSRLLFLLFSIFSPQNKMSRTTLIFFDFNKTEKLATFTRLREAIGVQSTTPDWEQYRKNLLFCFECGCSQGLPSATSWGARPGKGNSSHVTDPHLLPCHRAWATLASLGLLRDHQHSSGTRSIPWVSIPWCPKWGHFYLWLDSDRNHQDFACCGM